MIGAEEHSAKVTSELAGKGVGAAQKDGCTASALAPADGAAAEAENSSEQRLSSDAETQAVQQGSGEASSAQGDGTPVLSAALQEKLAALEAYLRSLGRVLVAFSSGVDSTLLLKVAHDVLGDNAIAATARSGTFPQRELDEAREFCAREGIQHLIVDTDELAVEGFSHNPANRCYLCKTNLFTQFRQVAAERGIPWVVEGSNMDDLGDYRPGMQAIAELDIKSPLREAGLTKADIRDISRSLGLSTWDKPSYACLASRFVYGEEITRERLARVDAAEQWLIDHGFSQVRVRIHEDLARIEVLPEEFSRLLAIAQETNAQLQQLGFRYVTMDLGGYASGSMNRQLGK